MNDSSWAEEAVCATTNPDLFFPDDYAKTRTVNEALKICAGCSARTQCLNDTPEWDTYSIRGGLTPRERKRIRRAA